jgi:hypothetical protein
MTIFLAPGLNEVIVIKRVLAALLLCALAAALLAGAIWIKRAITIDSCLDHGGKWNYETNVCVGELEK